MPKPPKIWDPNSTHGYLPHPLSYYKGLKFCFPDPIPDDEDDTACTAETIENVDIEDEPFDYSDSDSDYGFSRRRRRRISRHSMNHGNFQDVGVSEVFKETLTILLKRVL